MREKIMALEAFEDQKYEALDIDSLVMFAAATLSEMGAQLTLENIIVASFRLFPCKFSLSGYPEFVDATRVEKALWRSKGPKRKWIGGKTAHGYLANDRTYQIAEEIASKLSADQIKKTGTRRRLRRKESVIREITESTAFDVFSRTHKLDHIRESQFCFLMQGTLDTQKSVLADNLSSLETFAKDLGREDVGELLKALREKFRQFLSS